MLYLCSMKTMIERFSKKYKLPEKELLELLSYMREVRFGKGETIVKEGERNANFYILKRGTWRAYYLCDGVEVSVWFAVSGDTAFSSQGYVDNRPSSINIESINESVAYYISKPELEKMFSGSIEMANFGRQIFERGFLIADNYMLTYGMPRAKERYLTLLAQDVELLQEVPLKYLASYLFITPQSLSRIRSGVKKDK